MKHNRVVRSLSVVGSLLLVVVTDVPAQECGTLLFQNATVKKSTSVPVFRFKVKSGRTVFWPTDILLEIGHEGNSVTPPMDPALPAGLIFRVKRIDVPAEVTFPLSGGSSTTIPDKIVTVTRGVEPVPIVSPETSPRPQGYFAIQVVANTGTSVVEQWEVHIENLTGSWQIIASVKGGYLNGVTPAPAVCTGTPSTCPAGESCRGACPVKWCPRYGFYEHLEIVWPLPEPLPCLKCPPVWASEFDRARFERIFTTWQPTAEQRMRLDSARDTSVRFTVNGGEVIGDVFEGNSGEFTALVQYPRGQPPLVAVTAGGNAIGEFRAVPPEVDTETRSEKLAYGIGGLILGLLLGGLVILMRRRRGPGDTPPPAQAGRG